MSQSSMPLREFFREVFRPAKLNGTARWLDMFDCSIRRLGEFLGREATLGDLTEEHLTAWMRAGLAAGLSPVTVNGRAKRLASLWRYAKRKKFLERDAELELEFFREPRRIPKAWTIQQYEEIIRSARLEQGRFLGIPADKWWPAFLLVAFDTGLRKRAMFGLRFDMLNFETSYLCVPAELLKSLVDQQWKLHPQTIEALLETLPPRRPLMFPWPYTHHSSLYNRLRGILTRAELPSGRLDLLHKIRRTTATLIAQRISKAAAIEQLGHSDDSCIGRYIDPTALNKHHAAMALPRAAWDNPREIKVEVPETLCQEPIETVVRRYTLADLRGEGEDLFRRLRDQDGLPVEDLRAALDLLAIVHFEFADELGIARTYFSGILAGRHPLTAQRQAQCRVLLGLDFDRRGTRPGHRPPSCKTIPNLMDVPSNGEHVEPLDSAAPADANPQETPARPKGRPGRRRTMDRRQRALEAFRERPDGDTASGLRMLAHMDMVTFEEVLGALLADGSVEPCIVRKTNGQHYQGYKLADTSSKGHTDHGANGHAQQPPHEPKASPTDERGAA